MYRSALRSLCLVGLTLLLALSSWAADPAAAETAAAQPSPAKLEKIRKVLKATGADDAGDGLTASISRSCRRSIRRSSSR